METLPAAGKRGWRGRKGGSPASCMALRRPLAERPQSAADQPGHWEADLMLFRTARRCDPARTLFPHPHSRPAPWQGIQPHPAPWRSCSVIAARMAPEVTFATGPSSITASTSWVSSLPSYPLPLAEGRSGPLAGCAGLCRGGATGRFTHMIQAYNNTPRKCLQNPSREGLLHLKCESTLPASAGMTSGSTAASCSKPDCPTPPAAPEP